MYFIIMNAIAGSLGPTLVALATDYIAHSEADLRYVMVGFRVLLGPIGVLLLWRAIAPYGRGYRGRVAENS